VNTSSARRAWPSCRSLAAMCSASPQAHAHRSARRRVNCDINPAPALPMDRQRRKEPRPEQRGRRRAIHRQASTFLVRHVSLHTRRALGLLIKVVGADRVLLGTEHPRSGFGLEDVKPLIDSLRSISDADRANLRGHRLRGLQSASEVASARFRRSPNEHDCGAGSLAERQRVPGRRGPADAAADRDRPAEGDR
jgi:hypothetical protein